jgi:hypothetical protein
MLKGFIYSVLFATVCGSGSFGAYCLVKNILGHETRLVGILASLIGCLAVWFEPIHRRVENVYFFSPKVMETVHNAMVTRNILKDRQIYGLVVMATALGFVAVGSQERKEYVKPMYNKIFNQLLM